MAATASDRRWARSLATLAAIALATGGAHAVPSAPVNLAAQVSGSTVTLTWTPTFLGTIIGYRVEAGSASGLGNLASTIVGPIPMLTAPAVPNGTYFVRVRAIGSDGESAPSNEVAVTVGGGGACTAAPNPPVNLAATVTGMVIALSWAPGGGCTATNFVLHAGSAPGSSNVAIVNMGGNLALTASAPNGTYYLRAYAQNGFGTSGPSNELVVQIPVPTTTGIVVLASDDWILSDTAFTRLPGATATLAVNLARLLAPRTGRIHAYSDYFSLTGARLSATLNSSGFIFTSGIGIPFDVATLSRYDAVFMGAPFPTPSQLTVLEQYVAQGGNLYVHAGNGLTNPGLVPDLWNPLLTRYGLTLGRAFNGLQGDIAVSSTYPTFSGVSALHVQGGHLITGCCVVARATNGTALVAMSRGGRIP